MKHAILPILTLTILVITGASYSPKVIKVREAVVVKKFIDNSALHTTPLTLPLSETSIRSRFGRRMHPILRKMRLHTGVDFAASKGTSLSSQGNGRVIFAGGRGHYGKAVEVYHGEDSQGRRIKVLFAHLSEINVKVGQFIKAGDVIGLSGNTGRSTGPHLHYEYFVNSKRVNPLKYIVNEKSSRKSLTQSNHQQSMYEQLLRRD